MTPIDRFMMKVVINKENGCWEWNGCLNRIDGYGQFWFDKHLVTTHRFSYEFFKGQIPKGLHVLHRCDNRKCCNPAHLWLGTNQDNHIDKVLKVRQWNQKLTKEDVIEIRKRKAIVTGKQIGRAHV